MLCTTRYPGGAEKGNTRRTAPWYSSLARRTCRVSFVDAKGTKHTAEVVADSLYEAAIAGVKEISESWAEEPGLMTVIRVDVTASVVI